MQIKKKNIAYFSTNGFDSLLQYIIGKILGVKEA